ncbi:MAG TPA: hypothetical protein VF746_08120 [Longimicrobium sp.]|jgi:hypothetical protein
MASLRQLYEDLDTHRLLQRGHLEGVGHKLPLESARVTLLRKLEPTQPPEPTHQVKRGLSEEQTEGGRKRRKLTTPRLRDEVQPPRGVENSGLIGALSSSDGRTVKRVVERYRIPDLRAVEVGAEDPETGLALHAVLWRAGGIQTRVVVSGFGEEPADFIGQLAPDAGGWELERLQLQALRLVMATVPCELSTEVSTIPVQRGISLVARAALGPNFTRIVRDGPAELDLYGLVDVLDDGPRPPLLLLTYPQPSLALGGPFTLERAFVRISEEDAGASGGAEEEDPDPDERDEEPEESGDQEQVLRVAVGAAFPALGRDWNLWSDLPEDHGVLAFRLAVPSQNPVFEGPLAPLAALAGGDDFLGLVPEWLAGEVKQYRVDGLRLMYDLSQQVLTSAALDVAVPHPVALDYQPVPERLELTGLVLRWLIGFPAHGQGRAVSLEGEGKLSGFGLEMDAELAFHPAFALTGSTRDAPSETVRGLVEGLGLALDPRGRETIESYAECILHLDHGSLGLTLVDAEGRAMTYGSSW